MEEIFMRWAPSFFGNRGLDAFTWTFFYQDCFEELIISQEQKRNAYVSMATRSIDDKRCEHI